LLADDATRVLSGANIVKAADVRQIEGVTAMRVASPLTPGANSEATANGRLVSTLQVWAVSHPLTSLKTLRTSPSAVV